MDDKEKQAFREKYSILPDAGILDLLKGGEVGLVAGAYDLLKDEAERRGLTIPDVIIPPKEAVEPVSGTKGRNKKIMAGYLWIAVGVMLFMANHLNIPDLTTTKFWIGLCLIGGFVLCGGINSDGATRTNILSLLSYLFTVAALAFGEILGYMRIDDENIITLGSVLALVAVVLGSVSIISYRRNVIKPSSVHLAGISIILGGFMLLVSYSNMIYQSKLSPTEIVTQKAYFKYSRACEYIFDDRLNDAVKELDEAIALDPKEGEYYQKRAYAYIKKGDDENALINYRKAIEYGSHFVDHLNVEADEDYRALIKRISK